MEEKFLNSRQEREEQRVQRSKESDIAAFRKQYESEVKNLEEEVTQLLSRRKVAEAQPRINALRRLVQDTSNSIALTAHDMAKANALLVRLQHLVDNAQGTGTGPQKFKFSPRLKKKAASAPPPPAPTTVSSSSTAAVPSEAPTVSAGFGNSYGPATGSHLFIAHSKGAFINSCIDCTIYCLPIAGSVFLSNCANCKIYVACHQLRLKDCRDTSIFVWCASTPVIESCDGIRFGPYTCWGGLLRSTGPNGARYETHAAWVRHVGEIADTVQTERNYAAVEDFQWVRKTASPHWRVMKEGETLQSDTPFGPVTPPNSAA